MAHAPDRTAPGLTGNAMRRPSIAVAAYAALWLTAILSRFGYETHGVRLRLSEALAVVILLVAVISLRRRLVLWPAILLPFAYVAIETFSTLLNRADWGRGLKLDLLLAIEALIAVGAAYLVRLIDARTLARIIVGAGVLEALAAIVISGLFLVHATNFGVQIDGSTFQCKAYGTMYEANLLASYLGAVLVFLFATRRLIGPSWVQASAAGTITVAIGLTLTRAAWLAILAAVIVLLVLRAVRRTPTERGEVVSGVILLGLLAGAAVVVITAANEGICGHPNVVWSQGASITGRVANQGIALKEWAESPVIGLGTGSVKGKLVGDQNAPWISSLAIGTLHDTGIIGAIVVTVLIGLLLLGLVRRDRAPPPDWQFVRDGLAAAIVMLLVAFQATTGDLLEFPWVFVGTAVGVIWLSGRR
jgi:hypothetical protein